MSDIEPTSGISEWASWLLVGVALLWSLIVGPYIGSTNTIVVSFLITAIFVLVHGTRRYGVTGIVVFVVVVFVISNALENCSILTGFPFGHYHYTGTTKLFQVPISVGFFYIAIAYVSWQTANILLDRIDERMKRPLDFVTLPLLAAVIMTFFDLSSDPVASTIGHIWIWEEGGGYFGVPYTNFLGWLFVTYLFFQVFALYLARRGGAVPKNESTGYWLQALIMYLNLGVSAVTNFVSNPFGSETVTDARGTVWQVPDIAEAMLVVFIFTMCVVFLMAGVKLLKAPVPRTMGPT